MYDSSTPPERSMMSGVVAADKQSGRTATLALVAGLFAVAGLITAFALAQNRQPKELQASPVSLVTAGPESQDTPGTVNGATAQITIGALGSYPDVLTIAPGTTVMWVNNDSVAHNISGDEMGSDHIVQPGETVSFVYSQPGVYSFIDNGLAGQITVQQ